MKVLDATFLIDYLDGVDATAEYLLEHDDETFVFPAPVYAEVLAGEGNHPDGDTAEAKAALSWGEVYEIDEETATMAGEIASETGAEGPFLTGIDALVAAVGRELDAAIVSTGRDLPHEATKAVVNVDEYRTDTA